MSYRITVLPSQEQFVANAGENLLAAAKRQQLPVPHACQSGTCGSCKALWVSGHIERLPAASLDDEAASSGQLLLCCSQALSDVVISMPHYQGATAAPVFTLPVRVHSLQHEGEVAILTVDLPRNKPFAFSAGQYVDFLLPGGKRRSYSIASDPQQPERLSFHIRRRRDGLFSEPLFDGRCAEKSILRLQGPLGSFGLHEGNGPLVMLATGTGFAPMQSLLHALIHERSSRPVQLFWGGRQPADLYHAEQAAALVAQLANGRYTPVLSQAPANWQGARGHVQQIALEQITDWPECQVYAAGHPAMIVEARQLLTAAGLPATAFFADSFDQAENV